MSISAMKQALEALEFAAGLISPITKGCQCQICLAHDALRQAIAEAEDKNADQWYENLLWGRQEPVAWMWKDGTLTADPDYADGTWTPLFTKPVHAIDISQERVDETAKREHEPVAWMYVNTAGECEQIEYGEPLDDPSVWSVKHIEEYLKEKNT